MKHPSVIVLFFLFSSIFSNADVKKSAQMGVCSFLQGLLEFQVFHESKDLPTSWETFEVIGTMKKGSSKKQLFEMKTINSFALVPSLPIIQSEPGIPGDYQGNRLFLISREENVTKASGRGRCAIFIKTEGSSSKPVRTFSYFIPEETAQIILKQIGGFDPQKQPLAFENLPELEKEEKQFQDNISPPKVPVLPGQSRHATKDRKKLDDYRLWWVAVGGMSAFLIWIAWRNRSRR